jgi:hypothetical protein
VARDGPLYISDSKSDGEGAKNKPNNNAPNLVNLNEGTDRTTAEATEKTECVACGKIIETIPGFEKGKAYHAGCLRIS